MQPIDITGTQTQDSLLATHSVLRNTYLLLSLTLLFSGVTAGLAMALNAPPLPAMITIIGYFGLLFWAQSASKSQSASGLIAVFALTGFMGYTLGPIINMYTHIFKNGAELVMTALGGTGVIFLALSAYVLTTRKNFEFLGGFIFIASIIAFLAALSTMFFHIPALQLGVSAAFMLISSAMILFQTSAIIEGGERNYIMATIALYVSIYNLFLSLLQILGALNGRR